MFGRKLLSVEKERPIDAFLPQFGHLGESIDDPHSCFMRHTDGALWACAEVQGAPWEHLDNGGLVRLHEMLGEVYKTLSFRRRLTITTHLIRTEAEPDDFMLLSSCNRYARELEEAYRNSLLGWRKLFRTRMYIGILVRTEVVDMKGARVARVPGSVLHQDIEALDQAVATVVGSLGSDFGLRVVGLREEDGLLYSEPSEALRAALTCRWEKVPLVAGKQAQAICDYRPVFRRDGVLELRYNDSTEYAALFGLSARNRKTRSWMLDDMLASNYRFALNQSFGTMHLHDSQALVTRRWNNFVSSGDPAYEQRDALKQAANDLQARLYGLGIHNLTCMVVADDEERLRAAAKCADDHVRGSGCTISRLTWDIESYFGMAPGTEKLHGRAVPITTENFAAFAPMRNFPTGWRGGEWCDFLALFTNNGGNPFFWNPHTAPEGGPGPIPHVFFNGPTRSGKTLLMLAMLAFAAGKAGVRVLFWDKDRSGKLAILRMGGRYFEFAIGVDSGLAPLKAYRADDRDDMAHLGLMARSLILSDGGPLLKPEEERRLDLALRIVMEMPPSIRSWNEVRAFLGTDEAGPGARLRRWCKGFEYGWVLDNDNNLVDLGSSQISGIDQTHYLKHPIVCGPIQAELFYQAQKLSKDGMPTIWAIDECWQSFLNEVFRGRINDAIKTGIKQGISMWLSTQSPRDAISTDIGHTIKEQCITQFSFANASADWNDFGEGGLGYPRRAFEWIKSELPKSGGKGRFLLKQGEQYTPCKFDMGGPELENYRTELSGTTITVNLFDHVLQEVGDEDMDEAFRVFHQRRKEPTFLRKVRRHEQEMEAV